MNSAYNGSANPVKNYMYYIMKCRFCENILAETVTRVTATFGMCMASFYNYFKVHTFNTFSDDLNHL